jgi:hypothetical protein
MVFTPLGFQGYKPRIESCSSDVRPTHFLDGLRIGLSGGQPPIVASTLTPGQIRPQNLETCAQLRF